MSGFEPETIRTARLDLLPLCVGHAEEMAEVLSDPALHTFIGGAPDTPAELRSRYRRISAGSPDPAVSWLNWVVRLRGASCLTGAAQATVSAGELGPTAEVAWVVGTPW
ncbi:GNAT family N-acetyltransferase [Streptomonospora alba]|uniref:GNAT family N-acetyltransferase n=1 Tax=Streptomonospora alba TaxID=183763 RepID=UPI000A817E34|nr:GNAT family N-acetyltransferase [Streptomonospora alba]